MIAYIFAPLTVRFVSSDLRLHWLHLATFRICHKSCCGIVRGQYVLYISRSKVINCCLRGYKQQSTRIVYIRLISIFKNEAISRGNTYIDLSSLEGVMQIRTTFFRVQIFLPVIIIREVLVRTRVIECARSLQHVLFVFRWPLSWFEWFLLIKVENFHFDCFSRLSAIQWRFICDLMMLFFFQKIFIFFDFGSYFDFCRLFC